MIPAGRKESLPLFLWEGVPDDTLQAFSSPASLLPLVAHLAHAPIVQEQERGLAGGHTAAGGDRGALGVAAAHGRGGAVGPVAGEAGRVLIAEGSAVLAGQAEDRGRVQPAGAVFRVGGVIAGARRAAWPAGDGLLRRVPVGSYALRRQPRGSDVGGIGSMAGATEAGHVGLGIGDGPAQAVGPAGVVPLVGGGVLVGGPTRRAV